MIGMIGTADILAALALLILLAYRGIGLLLAPAMASPALRFSPEAPLLASDTQILTTALASCVAWYIRLFLPGAHFGRHHHG